MEKNTLLLALTLLLTAIKIYCLSIPDKIIVSFVTTNAGVEVSGTISGIQADIKFDPHDLSRSAIVVTASPATIQTGISIRDRHLQKPDFFNTEKHPLIVMRCKDFRKRGAHEFVGTFDLTIKGITRPVLMQFSRDSEGKAIRYTGSFEMNRLEFNLGERSLILDDLIKVNVEVVLLNDVP